MLNNARIYVFIAILTVGLLLLAGPVPAMEKLANKEMSMIATGDLLKTSLASLEKTPPSMIRVPEAAPESVPDQERKSMISVGDLLKTSLVSLQKTPPAMDEVSEAVPNLQKMGDSDLTSITAGGFHTGNYLSTITDQEINYWFKIDTEAYPLDVRPHTWFLIDSQRVHRTYYKWWELMPNRSHADYWRDAVFTNNGDIWKYDTFTLERRFKTERWEYENTKQNTFGDKVFVKRHVSLNMRHGYVIFFEKDADNSSIIHP